VNEPRKGVRLARPKVSPIQWLAVLTGVFALFGAVLEAGATPRSWSVFVQSALGVTCCVFAYQYRRVGGWCGVAWGISQTVVVKTDGFAWIGRQVLRVYYFTRENDPLIATGNVFAINVIGGFFACAWGWFLIKEQWRTASAELAGL
jgi:hypothetical protein